MFTKNKFISKEKNQVNSTDTITEITAINSGNQSTNTWSLTKGQNFTTSTLKIEDEHPDIIKNIRVLKFILLPLEYWCLKVLMKKESPLSTGFIYNWHLIEIAEKSFESVTLSVDDKTELCSLIGAKFLDNELNKKLNDTVKITEANYREIEKLLRSKKIKFHSYKLILQTLERLENWGLLKRRYPEKVSKINFYWIINPQFYLKYGKQLEELFKEENKSTS